MAMVGLKLKNKKWLIIVSVVLIAVGLVYFLGDRLKKNGIDLIRNLPAAIFPTENVQEIEEPTETKEEFFEEPIPEEKTVYEEKAGAGEGLTHLSRRVLKRYLQERPGVYQLTPEHKIYIEDYLATKKGGGWLKLGEEIEFSEDLIKEGIERARELTPNQLENLVQYSELVPNLDY